MNILEKSKKTLELDKVVSVLATYARTQQSQQLCLSIEPETDYEKIQENINFTKEAKELIDKLLELPIEHLTDLNTIDNNQLNSYLSERELLSLAKSLRSARLVKNFMRENTISDSCLSKLSMQIVPNKELEDQIFAKFDEADNIKKDATDVLSGLYSSLKEAEKEIKTKINELLNSHEFAQYLQEPIYTIRDNRIVFPIMASAKGKISGITHDVSATNKTAYIEPSQLVSMNNKIRELKVKIRDEVIKILTELT